MRYVKHILRFSVRIGVNPRSALHSLIPRVRGHNNLRGEKKNIPWRASSDRSSRAVFIDENTRLPTFSLEAPMNVWKTEQAFLVARALWHLRETGISETSVWYVGCRNMYTRLEIRTENADVPVNRVASKECLGWTSRLFTTVVRGRIVCQLL